MSAPVLATRALRTGVRVGELGLGGADLGNVHRAMDDETAAQVVETAWGAGIRHFDTAPHYGLGLSERRLGKALRTRPRDEFVISTKVGRLLVPDPGFAGGRDNEGFDVPADQVRRWDFTRDGVLRSLEASLDRLGLDRVDLAYVHDADDHWGEACRGAFPALVELRDQGVVRGFGAGMKSSVPLTDLVRRFEPDVVMVAGRYSLLEQPAAADLLPAASEHGTGVVVAGVYNSGLLSTTCPGPDALYDHGPAPMALVERARRLAAVCESHGVSLPEAAVAFPLRHPAVTSVVVGAASPEQVSQTVARYRTRVPDALWDDLDRQGLVPIHHPQERQ